MTSPKKESAQRLHGTLLAMWLFGSALVGIPAAVGPTVDSLTADQARIVASAEGRFVEAGLQPPTVSYRFYDDLPDCGWRRGLYYPKIGLVELCTNLEKVVLHEMAHAWAEVNMTAADKAAFLARRGLSTWASKEYPWEERGAEQVAEIITWGLARDNLLVRWVDPADGGTALRLLTIPDSDLDTIMSEYRLLTGREPELRDPAEWSRTLLGPDPHSPELAYAARSVGDTHP